MALTRREFLKLVAAAGLGALITYAGLQYFAEKQQKSRENTLEQILFGNSDIPFIPLEVLDVQLGTKNAYLTVRDYYTQKELQLKIPVEYLSNEYINIGDLSSKVNNYNLNNGTNYKIYLVLGRANVNKSILQNGRWNLPFSQIYYNILISDRDWIELYNALQNLMSGNATILMPTLQIGPYANSLWGWINQPLNGYDNIIILYQNGQEVNNVINHINLADYILGRPNDVNPTQYGALHVDNVASINVTGRYSNGDPEVTINKYLGTYIVVIPQQGNPLFPNL